MSRVAIIIPAIGSIEALERTLVSVLENRPADSEIVVALSHPYEDPYELKGEVQFVQAKRWSRPIDCVNQALDATRAPFVHVLASGCTVSEGWTEAALSRFGDRKVAAVAPLLIDADRQDTILSAGLQYHRNGRRSWAGRGESLDSLSGGTPTIIGPCGAAAFYRAAALEMIGRFCSSLSLAQADADVALSLGQAGLKCVLETRSRIFADPRDFELPQAAFVGGLREERLFWRNVSQTSMRGAVAAHIGMVAMESLGGILRPASYLRLCGRALACCQIGHYARRRALLEALRATQAGETPEGTRVDASHAIGKTRHSNPTAARVR